MWYKFTAYNSQTLYGWTDDQRIADAACDRLNHGREIDLYGYRTLTDEEAVELGPDGENCDVIFGQDTTLADYENED